MDLRQLKSGLRAVAVDPVADIGARMIIVGGAPRSGTSITQAVLDSHPQIFGGPEFDRLPEIARTRTQLLDSLQEGRIVEFCDRDSINESFGRLIESLLYPAMRRHRAEYISEKTPSNVLAFGALMDILPGAKFVEVVRDPRAVVNSMLAVAGRHRARGLEPPAFIANLEAATNTVRTYVHAGYAAYRKRPDRMIRIRYEDLVLNTEALTRELFHFLGIAWSPLVLAPGEAAHPAVAPLLAADGGIWDGVGGIRNVFDSSLEGWRESLDGEQQAYIAAVFKTSEPHLSLGYSF